MSFFDTLTRDGKYALMGAIRGPDVSMLTGMYTIKAQITARIRVIAFDLMSKTSYGDGVPKDELSLPGDENREVMTVYSFDAVVKAVKSIDGSGGRHYLHHLLDAFVRVPSLMNHSIWGGHGQEIKELLEKRITTRWDCPDPKIIVTQRDSARQERDQYRDQVTQLEVRIKGMETQANVVTYDQRAANDLVKAVKAVFRTPGTFTS